MYSLQQPLVTFLGEIFLGLTWSVSPLVTWRSPCVLIWAWPFFPLLSSPVLLGWDLSSAPLECLSPLHLFSYSCWLFSLNPSFSFPGPLEAVQETFAERLRQSSALKFCWKQVMKFLVFHMLRCQVRGEFRVFLRVHCPVILRCSDPSGAGACILPGIWYLAVFWNPLLWKEIDSPSLSELWGQH